MTTNQNPNGRMSLKKKLLITLGAMVGVVAIVVTSVLGTLAYLTSSAAVSNVFTIGNVGITMDEALVDADGKTIVGEGAKRVDTNTYKLMPGKKYDKDPVIHVNSGSEDSYLFVLVRNDLESIAWDKPSAENPAHPSIARQMRENGWVEYTTASTGKIFVYVGGKENTLDTLLENDGANVELTAGDYPLFKSFSVSPDADVSLYGAAKITLTAVAIQKDGFSSDAPGTENAKTALDKAWAAVIATYPYIHTGSGQPQQ